MHILLFIFYMVALSYAITRMAFFRNSRIRPSVLVGLFALRVGIGCLHNWVAWRYYPNHGDVWELFKESFTTRQELLTGFRAFWAANSNWDYVQHNVTELVHVLFNLFSFDDLYINTLFFNFFVFWGSISLFRCFMQIFQQDLLPSLTALLLPSMLFWTACMHTEGVLWLSMGFFFFSLYRLMTEGSNARRILSCLFFFGLMVFFRAALALTLLPLLVLWLPALARQRLESRQPIYTPPPTLSTARRRRVNIPLVIILLLLLIFPHPLYKALFILSDRQQQFQVLFAHSRLYLPWLRPTWGSFFHTLPYAFYNGLFQPLPGTGGQAIYSVFAAELIILWLIVIYASLIRYTSLIHPSSLSRNTPYSFAAGSLLFALSGMLIIGFIVPFAGVIIRYRSIYLPFLVAPFLHALSPISLSEKINDRLSRLFLSGT